MFTLELHLSWNAVKSELRRDVFTLRESAFRVIVDEFFTSAKNVNTSGAQFISSSPPGALEKDKIVLYNHLF